MNSKNSNSNGAESKGESGNDTRGCHILSKPGQKFATPSPGMDDCLFQMMKVINSYYAVG